MSRGLARLHRRLLADERALEVEAERENPLSGRGATPSMGLSEVRGGMVGGMIGPHWTWDDKHAERYGDALAKHLYHLHGAGFLDTLRDGFNSFKDKLRPIVNILKPIANVASMAPGPLGMVGKVASVPLGILGSGHNAKQVRKHGLALARHIHKMHGAGFFDLFRNGFNKIKGAVGRVAKPLTRLLGPALKIAAALPPELIGKNLSSAAKVGSVLTSLAGNGRPGFYHSLNEDDADMEGAGIYDDIKRMSRFKRHTPVREVMEGAGLWDSLSASAKALYENPEFWDAAMAALPLVEKYAPKSAQKTLRTVGKLAPVFRPAKAMRGKGMVGGEDEVDLAGFEGSGRTGGSATGQYEGEGRKKVKRVVGASDGRRKRAAIVKRIMSEKNLPMIEASRYVKEYNLY